MLKSGSTVAALLREPLKLNVVVVVFVCVCVGGGGYAHVMGSFIWIYFLHGYIYNYMNGKIKNIKGKILGGNCLKGGTFFISVVLSEDLLYCIL